MARFDVYANPDLVERKLIPYFLDVQSDHVKGLLTRVMGNLGSQQLAIQNALDALFGGY